MTSPSKRLSAYAIYSRNVYSSTPPKHAKKVAKSISNTTETSTFADEVPKTTIKHEETQIVTRRTRNNRSPVATTKKMSKRKRATANRKSKTKVVGTKSVKIESDAENPSIADDSENISDEDGETTRMSNGTKNERMTEDIENERMTDIENERMTDDIENERMTDDDKNNQNTSDEDSEGIFAENGEGNINGNGVFSPHGETYIEIPVIPKPFPCGNKYADELFKWLITPIPVNNFFTYDNLQNDPCFPTAVDPRYNDPLLDHYELVTITREIFEKCPYHIQRHNPTFYQGLFTVNEFNTIMKENRLNYDKQIDLVAYVDGKRTPTDNGAVVYPDYVWSSFQEGYSVRMRNPQAYHKSLWNMCSLLQEYFSSSVGANMYLTPADSQGFPPHFDDIDGFILQIEGKKHWKVYMPVCEEELLPRFSSSDLTEEEIGYPCLDLEIEAGDLLYIPRGFIHQAYASDEHSLHITISTNQLNTWGDLLKKGLPKALDEAINNNVELRKSLPKDYYEHVGLAFAPKVAEEDSPERKAFKMKYKQLSMDVLNHLSADDAADQHASDFLHGCMPPKFNKNEGGTSIHGNGHKYQAGIVNSVSNLKPETKIRWIRRRAFRLVVDEQGTRLVYTLGNSKNSKEEEMTFSEVEDNAIPAISALFKKHPEYIAIKDLPIKGGMDNKLAFAESLYFNGYLVTEEPLPTAL